VPCALPLRRQDASLLPLPTHWMRDVFAAHACLELQFNKVTSLPCRAGSQDA
jgi:hypothetical protein